MAPPTTKAHTTAAGRRPPGGSTGRRSRPRSAVSDGSRFRRPYGIRFDGHHGVIVRARCDLPAGLYAAASTASACGQLLLPAGVVMLRLASRASGAARGVRDRLRQRERLRGRRATRARRWRQLLMPAGSETGLALTLLMWPRAAIAVSTAAIRNVMAAPAIEARTVGLLLLGRCGAR